MSFWDNMEMWEKMLLVLAAAMFAVLVWGTIKLLWMKVQVKKHMKMDAEKKAQMEENRSEVQLNKPEDIPFGIKALEAGIEVEGVVVSRPQTPRASFQNPSNSSLMGSDVRDSFAPSRASSLGPPSPAVQALSSPFDHSNRVVSMQHMRPVYQPLQSSQVNANFSTSTSQSSSPAGTRFSSSEHLPNQLPVIPATLARLEGKAPLIYSPGQRRATTSPDGIRVPQVHSRTPSRSPSPPEKLQSLGEDIEIASASTSSHEEPNVEARRVHSAADYSLGVAYHGDLSLLHSHRLSHAAEVGQLARRPPNQRASQSFTAHITTPPVINAGSPSAYVIDMEQAVSHPGYHLRSSSEGALKDTLSPYDIEQNDVAYFEVPSSTTQETTPASSIMAREEIVDLELGSPIDDSSKRTSKKLVKKKRASA